jgi:hypothetical protein
VVAHVDWEHRVIPLLDHRLTRPMTNGIRVNIRSYCGGIFGGRLGEIFITITSVTDGMRAQKPNQSSRVSLGSLSNG